ncbi:MAG: D-2-hydroxyacid dehydrogenase [Armatimonadota bacterium]
MQTRSKIEIYMNANPNDPMIRQFIDRCNGDELARGVLNWHFGQASSLPTDVLNRIEVVCGGLPAGWRETMPGIRWIQFLGAGIESALIPELVESDVIITNASGVHAVPISEHILGMMLIFARQLQLCMRRQVNHEWNRDGFDVTVGELYQSTLGVIGLGNIGEALAQRAKCMGMRVIATRRRPEKTSPYVDQMLPPSGLDTLLRESDYIAVCTPLTNETRGMIGEEQFNIMKRNAVIVNIARGAIIDQDAMIRALQNGCIAGAGLDVTVPEPLPSDSPLWSMPNVVISPHVSGENPHYSTRAADIFLRNLQCYLEGDIQGMPTLVDRKLGY